MADHWTNWLLKVHADPREVAIRISPAMAHAAAHRCCLVDTLCEVAADCGLPPELVDRVEAEAVRLSRALGEIYQSGNARTLRITDPAGVWVLVDCIEGSTYPAAYVDARELGEPWHGGNPVRTLAALARRIREVVARVYGEPVPHITVPTR